MTSRHHAILIILFILSFVMIAGCSFLPFTGIDTDGQKGSIDVGFSEGSLTPETTTFRFDDAMSVFSRQIAEYGNMTAQKADGPWQIHYIHGMDVDPAGNAGRWVFVAGRGDSALLFSYDKYGGTIRPWSETLSVSPIPVDRILTPPEIFSRDHAIIFSRPHNSGPGRMELKLTGSTYALTITNSSELRTLEFDATTGALKGAHD